MRTKTLNDNFLATHPGSIRLCHKKMRKFHPELYPSPWYLRWFSRWFSRWFLRDLQMSPRQQEFWLTRHTEHLLYGDSRASIVVNLNPLVVAAYTDELDCVVLLEFPNFLEKWYPLQVGSRLLTVNLYTSGKVTVFDLEEGSGTKHRYRNFTPLIAEFLSNDSDLIQQRKLAIEDEEWLRTWDLAQAYVAKHGWRCRNGLPMHCEQPKGSLSLD